MSTGHLLWAPLELGLFLHQPGREVTGGSGKASPGPVIAEQQHPGGGLAQGRGGKAREGQHRWERFEKELEEGALQPLASLPRLIQRFLW